MEYPVVDSAICTGCCMCIEVCPMESIELVDNVAVINHDTCSNCRLCESECLLEAIS